MQHVPYRGAPLAWRLLSGQVQVMFDNLPSSIEHIRAGRLARARVDPTSLELLPGVRRSPSSCPASRPALSPSACAGACPARSSTANKGEKRWSRSRAGTRRSAGRRQQLERRRGRYARRAGGRLMCSIDDGRLSNMTCTWPQQVGQASGAPR